MLFEVAGIHGWEGAPAAVMEIDVRVVTDIRLKSAISL
jgi:hypothetical protein